MAKHKIPFTVNVTTQAGIEALVNSCKKNHDYETMLEVLSDRNLENSKIPNLKEAIRFTANEIARSAVSYHDQKRDFVEIEKIAKNKYLSEEVKKLAWITLAENYFEIFMTKQKTEILEKMAQMYNDKNVFSEAKNSIDVNLVKMLLDIRRAERAIDDILNSAEIKKAENPELASAKLRNSFFLEEKTNDLKKIFNSIMDKLQLSKQELVMKTIDTLFAQREYSGVPSEELERLKVEFSD